MEMKRYKLSEIGEVRMCKRILKEETNSVGGVPFFKIGTFGGQADVFITKEKFKEYKNAYSYPKKGDILISAAGTIGRTVVFDGKDAYFQDSNIVWIENDESKVLNEYLFYCYKNIRWTTSVGSTILRLYNDDIRNTDIIVPHLSEQKKISSVLSSPDDKIALNKKINAKLEAMAKRLYDYWFVQFDFPNEEGKPYKTSGGKMVWNELLKREIPEGWEVVEMSSVIKQINTGLNPRDNFILGNGKIKYITVKNLTEEGHIDFSNCDLVNSEAQKIIHERSQIQKGDILFASICPLGRCYLIQDSPEDWDINESVFSIRPNIDRITSEFLYTLLREAYYVKKMTQKATGSIFKGIRINDIEKIEIVLPPKEVINAFSKKTLPIFNYQLTIQKEIQKLTDLRDRLLPLLMNGQVEVVEK
jgi:type I restriction enzyme S subunit